MTEPESLVLQLLRDMRGDMADMREKVATKADVEELRSEIADLGSEMQSLRADVASDLMTVEKRLGEQIAGLRRAAMEYHSSAIGHGVLFSELDERLRRIERHLNLPPADAH